MEIKFPSNKIIKIKNRKSVKCPTCKNNAVEPFTPFCSKKCSNIDLVKWLSNERFIKDNDSIKCYYPMGM